MMKSRPRRRKGLEAKESVRASPSGSRSRVLVFVLLMGLAVLAYRSFQHRSIPVEAIRQAARGDGSFTDVTLQAHLGDDRFSQGVSPEKRSPNFLLANQQPDSASWWRTSRGRGRLRWRRSARSVCDQYRLATSRCVKGKKTLADHHFTNPRLVI